MLITRILCSIISRRIHEASRTSPCGSDQNSSKKHEKSSDVWLDPRPNYNLKRQVKSLVTSPNRDHSAGDLSSVWSLGRSSSQSRTERDSISLRWNEQFLGIPPLKGGATPTIVGAPLCLNEWTSDHNARDDGWAQSRRLVSFQGSLKQSNVLDFISSMGKCHGLFSSGRGVSSSPPSQRVWTTSAL